MTSSSKRPPRESRTGITSTGARKAASKSMRTRARNFALQALYQYLLGNHNTSAIDLYTRDLQGFHKADAAHYDALLHGCIGHVRAMDAILAPQLDRPLGELSPVEHAVLWIGIYELQNCPDIPLRVILYECIELAKEFGGTDGHKYVNSVLDKLAPQWRATEIAADANHKGQS